MRMFVRRLRPSPSMVVAFVALAVALGGTSYAVVKLPARSVGAKQLKAQSVKRAAIASNAIDGSKVDGNSLSGDDIDESSLSKVPTAASADRATSADRAANADNATNSGHAASSAALDKVIYKSTRGTVPAPVADTTIAVASAFCDTGQHAVGGGVKLDDIEKTSVVDTFPDAGGTVWTAHVDNQDTAAAHGFTVYVICVTSAEAG